AGTRRKARMRTMDTASGFGNVFRDMTLLYEEAVSVITDSMGGMFWGIPGAERWVEYWLGVGRIIKDSYVEFLEQGFEMWERLWRRMVRSAGADREPARDRAATAVPSPLESWIENWRRANEAFIASLRSGGMSEEAARRANEFGKKLEENLKELQKFWQ